MNSHARRVLRLMLALLVVLIAGMLGDMGTLAMFVVTGGRHPGWLQATRWVNRGMLAAGLTLVVLLVRAEAARREPPS